MRRSSVRFLVPFCVACVITLFLVHAAGAQVLLSDADAGTSTPPPSVTLHVDEDLEDELKSVAAARLWATGATAAGIGLGVATDDIVVGFLGPMFGPAAGSFYAGDTRRAWRGVGIRSAIVFGGVAIDSLFEPENNSPLDLSLNLGIFFGFWVSVFADIVGSSAASVREHNEEVRADQTASVSIGPWADPLERRPGVQVTVRF